MRSRMIGIPSIRERLVQYITLPLHGYPAPGSRRGCPVRLEYARLPPMAEAIAFDTHRFVKHLTENGFTEQQAEVLADEQVHLLNANLATQADIAGVHRDIDALRQATQADIAGVHRDIDALRQETKTSIAGVQREIAVLRQETKADIETLRQETKASIAEVQRDIAEVKSDLLKWMTGALIAQGGVIVALLKLLPG